MEPEPVTPASGEPQQAQREGHGRTRLGHGRDRHAEGGIFTYEVDAEGRLLALRGYWSLADAVIDEKG